MTGALQGKTALVTGAAGGIGQAIACALAEADADFATRHRNVFLDLTSLATRIERVGRCAALVVFYWSDPLTRSRWGRDTTSATRAGKL